MDKLSKIRYGTKFDIVSNIVLYVVYGIELLVIY